MQHTTGSVYRSYDDVIRRVEANLQCQKRVLPSCDDQQVLKRIAQQIAKGALSAYVDVVLKSGGTQATTIIRTPTFVLHTGTGQLSLNLVAAMRAAALVFGVWAYTVFSIMVALFRPCPNVSQSATLLIMGGSSFHHDEERFLRFCLEGPVEPLRTAGRLIVGTTIPPSTAVSGQISYHRFPLLHLVATGLTRWDRWRVLFQCLLVPLWFFGAILKCRFSILLDPRDFVWVSIAACLDRKGLIEAVIDTNSSFESQPLWAKGVSNQSFRYHMAWYSQNFIPKMYRGETDIVSLPSARHMRVDTHWVWTEGFRDYLRSIGQDGVIEVVGPLLWYLPPPDLKMVPGDRRKRISIFDVTPKNSLAGTFGAYKNYYTATTIRQFVADIVEICRDLEVEHDVEILIKLKHKRPSDLLVHDKGYIDFIDDLAERDSRFEIISSDENLYVMLAEADLSVAVPYTSTCYVGASFGRPAIYYDSSGELAPAYEKHPQISFSSDRQELRQALQHTLFQA